MNLDFGYVSAFIATTICGYRLVRRYSISLSVRLIWSLVSLLFILFPLNKVFFCIFVVTAYIVYRCCISHLTILCGLARPFPFTKGYISMKKNRLR